MPFARQRLVSRVVLRVRLARKQLGVLHACGASVKECHLCGGHNQLAEINAEESRQVLTVKESISSGNLTETVNG